MRNSNLQTGFSTMIVVGIVALVVIIGTGGYFFMQRQSEKTANPQEQETMEQKENEVAMQNEEDMVVTYTGTVLAGTSAPLLDFTKTDYEAAIASNKLVVLYFYADWCPICRAEFPKMQEAFDELALDNVVGFRVNYNDNQTDNAEKNLAREFGVAYQHTKVFLKNGERILKSPESWDKSRYISEIDKLK